MIFSFLPFADKITSTAVYYLNDDQNETNEYYLNEIKKCFASEIKSNKSSISFKCR